MKDKSIVLAILGGLFIFSLTVVSGIFLTTRRDIEVKRLETIMGSEAIKAGLEEKVTRASDHPHMTIWGNP